MHTTTPIKVMTTLIVVFITHTSSASVILEAEPNDSLAGAQTVDALFTLDADPDIADPTTVPHVSILGVGDPSSPAGATYDYYRFTVTQPNSQAVFDVDYGYTPGLAGSADTTIALWDAAGNPLTEEDNTWGDCSIDPGGSACYKPAGQQERLLDPFLQYTFNLPGVYYIGIAESAIKSDPVPGGWYYVNPFTGDITNPLEPGDTYTLHISLENAIVPEPATGLLLAIGGLLVMRRPKPHVTDGAGHATITQDTTPADRYKMKRYSRSSVIVLLIALTPSAATAIDNGGFETGDFSSWTTYQDVYAGAWFGGIQVLNSHQATTPDSGSFFAKLPANSMMSQDLAWQAGDTISFRYAFDGTPTTAMGRFKYALFQLYEDGNPNAIYNSEHIAKQTYWGSGDTNGWRDYGYQFTTTGTGHFDIGLWWWLDPGYAEPGYFYIDQVAYVPEPATAMLIAGGIVGHLLREPRRR